MLKLDRIALRRGPKLLFEDATMQAHAGQRIGVVGANGSGKSSLFALLRGELEADSGEFVLPADAIIAHVRQESPGSTHSALEHVLDGDQELRAIQNAIRQAERYPEKSADSVLHDLFERMEAIDGYGAEARAARLLDGLGFAPDSIHDPVESFSGGWRMRLNLAQALMCRSDILLLDEPTNHLDLPAILWLEQKLVSYDGILLTISHDRDFLDAVCTRIAHIEQQRVRLFSGNYSQFEKQRAEQLSLQQALHERQQKEIAHLQSFVDRFRYKASKARQAQSRLKMMERMTRIAPAHVDSPFRFRFLEPEKMPQHLLKLSEGRLGYGENTILDPVELSISAGDRIGLLGVNGAGKSTLVKALAEGSTLLGGERVLSKETRIGYFAQHQLDQLEPELSPFDHLREVAGGDSESAMRAFLGQFGFSGDRIFEPVAPFSGGEKARLVLALIVRGKPNLLLLDEPTNHLDLEMRQTLSAALMEYEGALVVIAHDRHLLRSVCDELMIVHDGLVERFDRSLDEYPDWLRERAFGQRDDRERAGSPAHNRKKQRQREARRRRELQPLAKRVRAIENELGRRRDVLRALDRKLADEALYADPARQGELTELSRERAAASAEIEHLESQWLEASETLEQEIG